MKEPNIYKWIPTLSGSWGRFGWEAKPDTFTYGEFCKLIANALPKGARILIAGGFGRDVCYLSELIIDLGRHDVVIDFVENSKVNNERYFRETLPVKDLTGIFKAFVTEKINFIKAETAVFLAETKNMYDFIFLNDCKELHLAWTLTNYYGTLSGYGLTPEVNKFAAENELAVNIDNSCKSTWYILRGEPVETKPEKVSKKAKVIEPVEPA